MQPWWYYLLLAAALAVAGWVAIDIRRDTIRSRRARDARRIKRRLNRQTEDLYWAACRDLDYLLALYLHANRVTETEPVPERLLRAVTD